MKKFLAIDIGGTMLKYGHISIRNRIIDKGEVVTPRTNVNDLLDEIVKIYRSDEDVVAIAVSLPGAVDSETGYCYSSGALQYYSNMNLANLISERCDGKYVHLENDGKSAVMAEARLGALKDVKDGFVIILGTGIGGGYVKDHKVVKGQHFFAGEVSFIALQTAEFEADNMWAYKSSTAAMVKEYKKLKELEYADGRMLMKAVRENDEQAIKIVKDACKEIARQICNIQSVIDVERFAIGGGISADALFFEYLTSEVDKWFEPYTNAHFPIYKPELVLCKYRNDANLLGCVAGLKDSIKKRKQ